MEALAEDDQFRHWEEDFAELGLAQGKGPIATAEVISDGRRRDLVTLLHEMVLDGADGKRRALVLGEPGSGKTTGLERLTLELAQEGARRRLWKECPIPVLLRLGGYESGDLLDFATKALAGATSGPSSKILSVGLPELLEKGHVVLLCDALDEALGEKRELVLAEMEILFKNRQYDKTPVVVTARTREDPGGRFKDVPAYTIQDLSDNAVREFVRIYLREGDSEEDALDRLDQARLLEPGGLGRNPFWLELVVKSGVFQEGAGSVGQKIRKGQILRQAVKTLLAREWDKWTPQRTSWQRVPTMTKNLQVAETHAGLAWLAYRMSENGVVEVEQDEAENSIVPEWLKERSNAAGLNAANVVGMGRDAQLLVYWPGPLRFRHRLIQEYLTANYLAGDAKRWNTVVAQHASETGWWETLLMLGHLTTDANSLAQAVLDDGRDTQRIFLAFGVLQGSDKSPQGIYAKIGAALGQSLSGGVTDEHRTAVGALARIMRADVVALLTEMGQVGSGMRRDAAIELLLELDEPDAVGTILNRMLQDGELDAVGTVLSRMLQDGDSSQRWYVLSFLAASADSGLREGVLATVPSERRTLYELALAQLKAPQPGAGIVEQDGMLLPDIVWGTAVPAGDYTVGGDKDASQSLDKQQVPISNVYQLARYPVTYAQFQCFVAAPDFADARWWKGMPEEESAYGATYRLRELSEQLFEVWNHPRESVSWYQAMAFCRWLSDKLGYTVDLPHEYEWEVAARYPDGRFYPWGNEFDENKANTREGGPRRTSPVGAYPDGANEALELLDMSGNAWEWCRNKYGVLRMETPDRSGASRALRGGSWYYGRHFARASNRFLNLPLNRSLNFGFRVVRVVAHLNDP